MLYTGDDRGWMAEIYLREVVSRPARVLVPNYGVQIGIPVISASCLAPLLGRPLSESVLVRPARPLESVQPRYGSVTVHHDSHQNSYNNSYSTSTQHLTSGSAYSLAFVAYHREPHDGTGPVQAATVTTQRPPISEAPSSTNGAAAFRKARRVTARRTAFTPATASLL